MTPTITPGRVEPHAEINPVQIAGMALLIPYLFIIYSRVFDFKFAFLHVPGILTALLIILVPASTQALRVLTDAKIGKYLSLFTIWSFAIVPFSVWRGGAFHYATQVWPHALLDYLCIGCMLGSIRGVRRAIYAIGFGVVVLSIGTRLYGDLSTGRLMLRHGLFANPNDLATAILMGFPFLLFVLMEAGGIARVLALAGMVPAFWALIHTGSRAGLLGFTVVAVFLFFQCSIAGKLLVAVGGVAVVGVALFLLPHKMLERYVTLFQPNDSSAEFQLENPDETDNQGLATTAAGSAQERWINLIDSLKMTLHHPITGVGMGNYPVARQAEAAPGVHVRWLAAHNAYTEVSSETGLVGFFFYIAAFLGSIRLLHRLRKFANTRTHPQWQTISRAVFCLQTSLVSYSVTSFFASVAYLQIFPTLAGLTLALAAAAQPQFDVWQKQLTGIAPAANTPAFQPRDMTAPLGVPAVQSRHALRQSAGQ